uniref:Uncharacterized protein n=1 Tax=Anguilla anguilla TaxID=7936 RepID=A0A0E9XJZ7_ANGAN
MNDGCRLSLCLYIKHVSRIFIQCFSTQDLEHPALCGAFVQTLWVLLYQQLFLETLMFDWFILVSPEL